MRVMKTISLSDVTFSDRPVQDQKRCLEYMSQSDTSAQREVT